MAAPVVEPDSAIIIHTTLGAQVDLDPVLLSDEAGMLVSTVDYAPVREEMKKKDHVGRRVISLYSTPEFTMKFDAEIFQRSACTAFEHPAHALELSDVENYASGFRFGFPDPPAQAYFILKEPGVQGRQGDLYKCAPTYDMIFMPAETVVVAFYTV